MSLEWSHEQEQYLQDLKCISEELSLIHKASFRELKKKERYYRIPCIIIGSISGTMSFGTNTFPASFQRFVSILVGGVSLSIAILQSIESYLKIGERMAGHISASQGYSKLAEDIHLELRLQIDDRCSTGISFTRACYERFEKLNSIAPYTKEALIMISKSKRSSPCSSLQSPALSPSGFPMTIHIRD